VPRAYRRLSARSQRAIEHHRPSESGAEATAIQTLARWREPSEPRAASCSAPDLWRCGTSLILPTFVFIPNFTGRRPLGFFVCLVNRRCAVPKRRRAAAVQDAGAKAMCCEPRAACRECGAFTAALARTRSARATGNHGPPSPKSSPAGRGLSLGAVSRLKNAVRLIPLRDDSHTAPASVFARGQTWSPPIQDWLFSRTRKQLLPLLEELRRSTRSGSGKLAGLILEIVEPPHWTSGERRWRSSPVSRVSR
jgi:hypothetical protein